MTDPQSSAIAAFIGGSLLAFLLVVPYVAWSYRKRGEWGWGHAVLAFGMLVYALALWTYTLLPVANTTPQWCAVHGANHPQLWPLRFLADMRAEQVGTGIGAWLRNPALQQALFNVALFVPLGMFGRHLLRRGPVTVVLAGFGVSLLIECTQLTAVWGLFACPYRLFDVDDLLTNTAGAALGIALAGLLRLIPGQKVSAPPGHSRPVTTGRRLLGMAVDLLAVALLGTVFGFTLNVIRDSVLEIGYLAGWADTIVSTLVPAVLLLLVVPVLGNGATIGQRAVLIKPVGRGGDKPPTTRTLIRFLAGSGGFFLLLGLSWHPDAAPVLFVVSGIMAWRPRDHRGLSGVISGLRVVDTRDPADDLAESRFREPAPTAPTTVS